MVATLVCLGAFGIMFVLLTWALRGHELLHGGR